MNEEKMRAEMECEELMGGPERDEEAPEPACGQPEPCRTEEEAPWPSYAELLEEALQEVFRRETECCGGEASLPDEEQEVKEDPWPAEEPEAVPRAQPEEDNGWDRVEAVEYQLSRLSRKLDEMILEQKDRQKAAAAAEKRLTRRAAAPAAFLRGVGSTLLLVPLLALGAAVSWSLLRLLAGALELPVSTVIIGLAACTLGGVILEAAKPLGRLWAGDRGGGDEEWTDEEDW